MLKAYILRLTVDFNVNRVSTVQETQETFGQGKVALDVIFFFYLVKIIYPMHQKVNVFLCLF